MRLQQHQSNQDAPCHNHHDYSKTTIAKNKQKIHRQHTKMLKRYMCKETHLHPLPSRISGHISPSVLTT